MVAFLKVHPEVGMVGPQLLNPDKTIQHSCARFRGLMNPLYRRTLLGRLKGGTAMVRHYLMVDADHTKIQPVDWLLGACLMLKRNHLTTAGLLDERFFLYFEDIDWCRRFWAKGLKIVYLPTAHMIHYHRRLSAEDTIFTALFSAPTRAHIASGIKYFWKYRKKIVPKLNTHENI